MPTKADTIGNELQVFRVKQRIQSQVLARHSKMRQTKLSRIENGWVEPSELDLAAMSKGYAALGIRGAQQFIRKIRSKLN